MPGLQDGRGRGLEGGRGRHLRRPGGPRTITKTTKPTRHVAATAAIHLKTRSGLVAWRPRGAERRQGADLADAVSPRIHCGQASERHSFSTVAVDEPAGRAAGRQAGEGLRVAGVASYHSAARSAGSFSARARFRASRSSGFS